MHFGSILLNFKKIPTCDECVGDSGLLVDGNSWLRPIRIPWFCAFRFTVFLPKVIYSKYKPFFASLLWHFLAFPTVKAVNTVVLTVKVISLLRGVSQFVSFYFSNTKTAFLKQLGGPKKGRWSKENNFSFKQWQTSYLWPVSSNPTRSLLYRMTSLSNLLQSFHELD